MINNKGILISYSGIDGAGKSTQIKLLKQYLTRKGYKVKATEEMFGYYLLKPIIGILRSATDSPKAGPVKRNKNLLLKIWFIPAFFDIWINYIFSIKPALLKYDFLIADRFYTDIWANLLYYGYSPSWAFTLLIKFLPRANKSLILIADPKIILTREQEFPDSYYFEQEKIYKNLAREIPSFIIDANKAPDRVFAQVKNVLKV